MGNAEVITVWRWQLPVAKDNSHLFEGVGTRARRSGRIRSLSCNCRCMHSQCVRWHLCSLHHYGVHSRREFAGAQSLVQNYKSELITMQAQQMSRQMLLPGM